MHRKRRERVHHRKRIPYTISGPIFQVSFLGTSIKIHLQLISFSSYYSPTIPLTLPAIILFLEPTLTLNYSFYNLECDHIGTVPSTSILCHYPSPKRPKAILSLSMPLSLPYRYKLSSRQRKWR